MRNPIRRISLLLAVALATMSCNTSQLRVDNLKTEYMENPSTLDTRHPRFSWVNHVTKTSARGQQQTAYQIGVASSLENLKAGKYDMWDSGQRSSGESHLVKYGGKELESGKDYYWRVRTWDREGKASAWSRPARWGMGLLEKSDWKATWIDSPQDDGGVPLFRKTFSLDKKVKQAKVFVCGLGFFELYLNGKRVGDDYLVPNLSNYNLRPDLVNAGLALEDNFTGYRVLYLSYDVTDYLKKGENAAGMMLGNGFYHPDKPIAGNYGHPCMILQLAVTYQDGTVTTIVSDESWTTRPSAITYSGIYQGETYDANRETPRWAEVDCPDPEAWKPVRKADGPIGELTAQASPSDKITEVLQAQSLKKVGEKKYEVDFGKEISGWIRFKNIEGAKGDTLRVNYVCESPQGTQNYLFNGNGKASWAPHFTWFVFSKAVISGIDNLTTAQLQAEAVNTDVKVNTEFSTSNDLLNTISTIWQRSQIDNMHGCIASDCPHRERLPYTGDGQAACSMVMHTFDAAPFYQKWIRDVRDAQDKDSGYVPNSAPWQPGCGGGVPWGAAMNVMPWEFYLHYGDRQLLEDCMEPMEAQVNYMLTWLQPDGTMFQKRANVGKSEPNYWFNLGDWCPPYGLAKDDLVHTFYLWHCADITAKAAHVLGRTDEEQKYREIADKTRESFHRAYYDEQNGTYGESGANIFALAMGVPEDRLEAVKKSLRQEIKEKHDGHVIVGFVGMRFFLEVLSEYDMHDLAYESMNKTDFPSFGYWIAQGATTTWEQWDCQNSHNHPMFGSGLVWFYRTLAGVRIDESQPAFRHFFIEPVFTAELPYVKYAHDTPYGRLVSELQKTDGVQKVNVTVPVGCTATLCLPAAENAINESGRSLDQAQNVSVTGQEDGRTCIKLEQGSYSFSFK